MKDKIPPISRKTIGFSKEFSTGDTLYHGERGYELIQGIGVGGMGQVWQAKDLSNSELEKQDVFCAIKLLPSDLVNNKRAAELLKREAVKAARISHSNVINVQDWAVDPTHNTPFIIMEYLQGKDFGEVLTDEECDAGGLPFERVVTLLRPVCDALQYTWEHYQIVHRDIKLENLYLTQKGIVKVLDFGISAQAKHTATQVGLVDSARTPGYSAPELKANRSAHPNQDVFSLGVVAYELLSGTAPFSGDREAGIEPKAISQLPASINGSVNTVIQQAMAYDPEKRQQSVSDFCADLRANLTRLQEDSEEWAVVGDYAKVEIEEEITSSLITDRADLRFDDKGEEFLSELDSKKGLEIKRSIGHSFSTENENIKILSKTSQLSSQEGLKTVKTNSSVLYEEYAFIILKLTLAIPLSILILYLFLF